MRVLFISANRTEVNMRTLPLGTACVAQALEQAGHDVQVLDLMDVTEVSESLSGVIRHVRPEVIGISLRNIDDQNMGSAHSFLTEANAVIREVKSLSSAPIILGGAGYSIFPESALERSAADMGICGEGEEPFRLLLERIGRKQPLGGIPGLYVRGKGLQGARRFVRDLDRLPLPHDRLLTPAKGGEVTLPVQTRRGCPLGCSYCSTASIEGRSIRRRSPKKVVEWIAGWTGERVRHLYFVDNTFNMPASYAENLCRELAAARCGVSWRCIVYPCRVEEGLAALMAEAGCTEASVGFESGCERILRTMKKRFGLADVTHTRVVLRKFGIRCMGFLLLGGPGETRDSVKESLAFADSLDLDALKVTIGIRIYPRTPLAAAARKEGVIAAGDDLLSPRFYMAPGLEEWVRETVAAYAEGRPNWTVDG
jgi:radical SAM superfamily enzyme YgiQ (UPF0313 family)